MIAHERVNCHDAVNIRYRSAISRSSSDAELSGVVPFRTRTGTGTGVGVGTGRRPAMRSSDERRTDDGVRATDPDPERR